MLPPTILSARDRSFLESLGIRVRMLTPSQVSRAFFDGDDRSARRRIKRLLGEGLITSQSLVARVSPPLDTPLLRWSSGEDTPNFSVLSARLIRRWQGQPCVATRVISLGPHAARLMGTARAQGVKNALQVGHDLALSEVYVRYLSVAPELTRRWFIEDRLPELGLVTRDRGHALPDAMLLDDAGAPMLAIELGGLYSAERLQSLHRTFSDRRLNYELW